MATAEAKSFDLEVIRVSNLNRVKYLAICFMMLLTAYNAAQNLMGQLYKQMKMESLSKVCFFCLFLGIIAASLVSNHYYKKVSLKVCMMLGAAGHVAFLFSGFLVAVCDKIQSDSGICSWPALYVINGLNAILAGTGIAFIWLAQARYVNLCADEATRGKFNGIFWAVSQVCQILSACLATFVLGLFDKLIFYCILTGFGVVSILMLSFVPNPVPYKEEDTPEIKENFKEAMQTFKIAAKNPKHVFLFSAVVFSGIATSFYATSYGKLTGTTTGTTVENERNLKTGYAFIVLAFGEVAAGVSVASLADKLNKLRLLGFTILVNFIALILTLLGYFNSSYIIMVLTGFFWGFGDTAINTMLGVVIGSRFNARAEMFACMRFFQASGGLITSTAGLILFDEAAPMTYIICMIVLMIIFQVGYYVFYPKEGDSSKGLVEDNNSIQVGVSKLE